MTGLLNLQGGELLQVSNICSKLATKPIIVGQVPAGTIVKILIYITVVYLERFRHFSLDLSMMLTAEF